LPAARKQIAVINKSGATNDMKIYLLSASIGGPLGVALYAVITFLNNNPVKMFYGVLSLLVGFIVSVYIVFLFMKKHRDIYLSPRYKTWMVPFLLVNQYFGIVSGLVVGVIASWLSLFPYSIIFGHPESSKWSPTVANIFMSISALIVIISLSLFSRWFFKGGIAYLKKRTCS